MTTFMPKNKLSSWFIPTIWLLFMVLLLALILRPGIYNLDPDLPWHLKFGRDTLITKQLPNDQIHLWTLQNETWVDHEWLTNVLMFWSFDHLGYFGLNLLFALIVLGVFGLIAYQLKKKHQGADYFIMAFLLLSYLAILPHLGPRPQTISLLFLALELLILEKTKIPPSPPAGGFDGARQHRLKTTLLLAGLFWLWACLHAGFLIGLMVLALWSGEQLIVGWRQQNPKKFWLGLQAGCLSFVVTLITPYGFKLYDFLSTYQNNAYLSHINEWKSFYIFPLNYWQLLFIAIIVAFGIALFGFGTKLSSLKPWQWLSLLIFLGLGLKSVRHFPLFFVVACLTFVPVWLETNAHNNLNFILPKWARLSLKTLLLITLLSLSIFSWWSLPYFQDPFQSFCQDYPCQTVQALKANPKYSQLKLFNQYSYGGWLIWAWPDKQLFIDGRLPQYNFADWSLLEEYLEFTKTDALAKKLKGYNIEAVLWNNDLPKYRLNWLDKFLGFKEKEINNRQNNLKDWLDASPDWQAVFKDEASTIYIRKDKL